MFGLGAVLVQLIGKEIGATIAAILALAVGGLILPEGLHYVPKVEMLSREGSPERGIIQYTSEWNADLIVICPRSPAFGGSTIGPKRVEHVARFELDHAPCPVLLIRPPVRE